MAAARKLKPVRPRSASGTAQKDLEAEFRRAVLRNPGQREAWTRLAVHCFEGGEMQSAISFAEAALALPPTLAVCGESRPRTKTRDFSPDQGDKPQEYREYREVWQRRAGGKDPLSTRRDFGHGLLGPNGPLADSSAVLHGVLYRALLSLGQKANARPHFEECRALDPKNPVYAAHVEEFFASSKEVPEVPRGRVPVRRPARREPVPSFSVVTVVRNESQGLPHLLESLAEFRSRGGEVVVLDTGSDDDTVKLAKEMGCVVVSEPHRFDCILTAAEVKRFHKNFARDGEGPFIEEGARIFDFASARNRAARLARNPFQLGVDGRDVIDVMDVTALDERVRSGEAHILYFETRRLHRGTWVLEARDYFHDRRHVQWLGRAHNFTGPLDGEASLRRAMVSRDELRVTHHSDETKIRAYQLAGVVLDVLSPPRPVHRLLVLGHELVSRGHLRSALAIFLELDSPEAPAAVRSTSLEAAAVCRAHLEGRLDLEMLFKAAHRDPARRQPLLQLGRHFLASSDFRAAAAFAAAALAIPPRVGATAMESDLRAGPHAILYWALFWLGRRAEARFHYETAQSLDPLNPLYREHARFFPNAQADPRPFGKR